MNIPRFGGVNEEQGSQPSTLSEKRLFFRAVKLTAIGFLMLCIWTALETTVFSSVKLPLLSPAAPSLSLLFFLCAGFFYGEKEGCVCGFMAGVVTESVTGQGMMILPLVFCIMGYGCGLLAKVFLGQNLPSFLVYAAMGSIVENVYKWICMCIEMSGIPSAAYLLHGLLPRFVLTVIFSAAVYLTVKLGKKIIQ